MRKEEKLCDFFSKLLLNDYYKRIVNKQKLNKESILDYYNEFPMMNRQDVLENLDIYVSDSFKKDMRDIDMREFLSDVKQLSHSHDKTIVRNGHTWIVEFTTGTTGKPFPVIKSQTTHLIESSYLLRKRKKICPDISLNNGFLFLHSNFKKLDGIDVWKFNEQDMQTVINMWKIDPPIWMLATPLVYYNYAKYMENNSIDIFDKSQLGFIEYTSQSMLPEQKELIDKYFKTSIVNSFGSREFWNIAYQCKNGAMHINEEYLIVDIVDDDGKIINEYNKIGDVVITSLINFDMPLVKYRLGDRAIKIKNNCSCGCKSDILKICDERENARLKNTPYFGTKIFRRVMRGIYFHDYFSDIDKIRIIQDKDYHLTVYVKKSITDNIRFETQFIKRTKSVVPEFEKFEVDFVYNFKYTNEDYRLKDVIFKCIV